MGHFNFVRQLERFELGEQSSVGHFNLFGGIPNPSGRHFSTEKDRSTSLVMGNSAAITSWHRFDCSNAITIGSFATIAGWNSQFVTHAVDIQSATQRSAAIEIGDYCFVGTRCTLLPGSRLPDYSVLGAMSLLKDAFLEDHTLYAGVPARPKKRLDAASAYFTRAVGYVD